MGALCGLDNPTAAGRATARGEKVRPEEVGGP